MKDDETMTEEFCKKCMFDAPYEWCCKRECNKHDECKECTVESKGYRSDSEPCS